MSGPILVTGADRSGTTLLYQLLASHPNVSMVRRTNMFRWFHDRFGDLAEPGNLDRCLEVMLAYDRLAAALHPDEARIREEFARRRPSYGALFSVIHEQQAERRQRPRWGDKSLHTEHHAEAVFAEWPDASIIQLVRDPRDRHASVVRRYSGRGKGIGSVTGRWILSVRAGERNVDRYPDRYMLLRYEDLVHDTRAVLDRVCEMIGEPYDPMMMRMDGAIDAQDSEGNSSFETFAPGTISPRSIGRFRSVLSPQEIRFIEMATSPWMKRLGYEQDRPAVPDLSFRASYLPVNLARLGGWMVAATLDRARGNEVPERRLNRAVVS